MKKNREGFTLIEMLVVIAIIGALAAVIVLGLGSARSKARDTRRLADLRQIQNFLENRYKNIEGYPKSSDFFSTYATSGLPTDPEKLLPYFYCTSGDQTKYVVAAMLENSRSETNTGFLNDPPICSLEDDSGNSDAANCELSQSYTFCVSND
jgi:prepilin-type N-terminal cleavage/methylation domain-containing protein